MAFSHKIDPSPFQSDPEPKLSFLFAIMSTDKRVRERVCALVCVCVRVHECVSVYQKLCMYLNVCVCGFDYFPQVFGRENVFEKFNFKRNSWLRNRNHILKAF